MSSDRWEEINRPYNAAVEVDQLERASFLEKSCREDVELRHEVESLLAYDQQAQQLLDRSALQVTAQKLASEPPSLVGRKLGPYQVLNVLGAGGMGEVYRARDTRLNRTVAIKVLPKHLSERVDLRQRFEREARAIASLDHPHICALYDIGQQRDTGFLVMQYLEGQTLSQRLKKGPLATEEVLRYAIEIGGALDTAHRKGVIHRDLKPGNIMLTATGAKLLDFGLAKRAGGAGAPRTLTDSAPQTLSRAEEGSGTTENARRSARSTQSESLTEEGMLLGTLEYMAPEQLEGKEADARTDIFALGVAIYEMATGRKAFEGDSKASVIAKILTFQPPLIATFQPTCPPELDTVVQKCLAKKPEERWQTATAMTSELQEIAETVLTRLKVQKREREQHGRANEIEPKVQPPVAISTPAPPTILSRLIHSRAFQLGFAGILLAVIAGSFALWRARQQPKASEKPKEMSFKPLTSYSWDDPFNSAAISPDGKYLAFCSKGKLLIQVIRSGEKRPLALPEGFYPAAVSWFPDGTKLLLDRPEPQWIQVKGEMIRLGASFWSLSILGGVPQKIVDRAAHASVSPDGSLLAFRRTNREQNTVEIWLVNTNGESPRRIRTSEPNQTYYGPVWSSNGQRLFYPRNSRAIESCDLRGEQVTNIFYSKDNYFLTHCLAQEGRLVFLMFGQYQHQLLTADLWEIKVDAATGRPLSEARRLTQWSGFGSAQVTHLSVTADGEALVALKGHAQADVYVAELRPRGKVIKTPQRLTLSESDEGAWDWTGDGQAVLFTSNRNGNWDIFRQNIGETDAEVIAATPEYEWHPNFGPDGAFIFYLVSEKPGPTATRLVRVPVGGGPPEVVLRGEKIRYFSCAREANLCVVVEEVEGDQVLTTFDPLKGRGEQLLISGFPEFSDNQNVVTARILSPQGRLLEKMKSGPEGLRLQVRSLKGAAVQEVVFKNLTGDYQFNGWSFDGKGIYITEWNFSDFTLLYAGLDAHSQVLWKRGTSPGWSLHYPIPSPDGRYLAFTAITYEANAWMLENF